MWRATDQFSENWVGVGGLSVVHMMQSIVDKQCNSASSFVNSLAVAENRDTNF